ncbi:MAG: hypothetical protein FWF03_07580 [Defluviitaleaceae bacterium]|nr:hypothetical protein [Defluviitaleaceae bacterium]
MNGGASDFASKKYGGLHPPLIERLFDEESRKRGDGRETDKAVKNKLHMIYGAYLNASSNKKIAGIVDGLYKICGGAGRENEGGPDPSGYAGKLAEAPDDFAANCNEKIAGMLREAMSAHASTRERLPNIAEFYGVVFGAAGRAETLLDLGCGCNPYALGWMPRNEIKRYFACDVDAGLIGTINRLFAFFGLPKDAFCADLAAEGQYGFFPPGGFDLVFMLKLIPVLEAQSKGRGYAPLDEIDAKHFACSFPVKTLGGRDRGFEASHSAAFEENIAKRGEKFKITLKRRIGSELLYIVAKG